MHNDNQPLRSYVLFCLFLTKKSLFAVIVQRMAVKQAGSLLGMRGNDMASLVSRVPSPKRVQGRTFSGWPRPPWRLPPQLQLSLSLHLCLLPAFPVLPEYQQAAILVLKFCLNSHCNTRHDVTGTGPSGDVSRTQMQRRHQDSKSSTSFQHVYQIQRAGDALLES